MTLQANALVDLALAKSYLKIPVSVTTDDTLVEFWINAASDWLENKCDRVLKARTVTGEKHHGNAQNLLMLRQYPIQSVTSVKIDGDTLSTDDYEIADRGNCLLKVGTVWPQGFNNIEVTYSGGENPVPTDLQNACLWLITWWHKCRNAEDIGRTTKSKEGETVSYLQTAPKEVWDAVANHKRMDFDVSTRSTSHGF